MSENHKYVRPRLVSTRDKIWCGSDRGYSEKDPDWHLDIKEDVEEECQKHGRLKHVFVDRNSLGHVYVRFGDSGPAQKVVNTFNGRE